MKTIWKMGRMAVLCVFCFLFFCLFLTACKPECRHQVDDWTVTKEPTCNGAGVKQGVCTLCDKTVTSPIAQLGHDYEVISCLKDKTCRTCGHTTSAENDHVNVRRELVDLRKEGFCSESRPVRSPRIDHCEDCGKLVRLSSDARFACDAEEKTEEYTDKNGYLHTVVSWRCDDCGASLYDDTWTEPSEGGKERAMRHYLLKKGDKVLVDCVFGRSLADHTHEYQEFYDFYGEDCDDGYLLTQVCLICGYSTEHEGKGHQDEIKAVDLSRYSACGGFVYYDYCAVCEQILREPSVDFFCNASETVEETVDDHGNTVACVTRDCVECGLRTVKSDSYVYEGCASQRVIRYAVSRDGQELLSLTLPLEREICHDYEYTYDAPSGSCEMRLYFDVDAVCRACGDRYSFTNRGCFYFNETVALGSCGTTLTQKRCDICGQIAEKVINPACDFESVERTYTDENGFLHTVTGRTCDLCGFAELKDKYSIPNYLSEHGNYWYITIMDNPATGNVELVLTCPKYGCREKNFLESRLPEGMDDEFEAYRYLGENRVPCYACGTLLVSPCERLEIERRTLFVGEDCYNDQTIYLTATAAHEWESDVIFANGRDCEGGWKKTDTCTVCGYVRNVENTGHETDWQTKKNVLLGSTCEDGYEVCLLCTICGKWIPEEGPVRYSHLFDPEAESTLVMKGDSCVDGWEEHAICCLCGRDVVINEGAYHKTSTNNDTRVYDTPCGPLTVYGKSCPCGAVQNRFTASCTAEPFESYDMREIDGMFLETRISTCPVCGFREEYVMYAVGDGCDTEHWQAWFFYYGDEKVSELKQKDASSSHVYAYENGIMLGDTCEDGVICDEVCTRCGLRETTTVYDHRVRVLLEQVDATPYGCCEGSAFGLVACPCGYETGFYNSFVCSLRTVEETSWESGVHTQVMKCTACGLTCTTSTELRDGYDLFTNVIAAADGRIIAEFTHIWRHPEDFEDSE